MRPQVCAFPKQNCKFEQPQKGAQEVKKKKTRLERGSILNTMIQKKWAYRTGLSAEQVKNFDRGH